MAATGPKGRDGPSPREFTTVRHFMMADLGLSGLPLLVYARIFGFCDAGCGYFESKGGRALLRRAGAEGVPALRRRPRSARRGAGGQGRLDLRRPLPVRGRGS